MRSALSLTPLLRSTIGFDRFNDLFQSLGESDETVAYPPYNIEKQGEDRYAITMAVAGFTDKDIHIVVQNDRLNVTGRIEGKQDTGEYLYRGIATRAFERSFRLADHMKVTGAELNNGLLRVELAREIPEEKKPRAIAIKTGNGKTTIEQGNAA